MPLRNRTIVCMAQLTVLILRLMRSRTTLLTALLLSLLVAAGCAVNPVTGKQELSLISTQEEIAMGQEHYLPLQQADGGLYKIDQALTDYVASVGQRVAAVSDRSLPYEFVVLNNSSPNAWALPGGKIAITRGLLVELENEAEFAAVLGHEVVHAAAKHGAHAMQRDKLGQLIMAGAAIALKGEDYANYILEAGKIGLQLAHRAYGRDAERDADYYGMKYMHAAGYDTVAAVTLQEKFVALAEGHETNWLKGLFASHPPSTERVENNRTALAAFPGGGALDRSAYEARMADLRAHKSAYEEAERARRELGDHPETALQTIESAISQEPREPLFYGIKGQILAHQGRYKEAVRAYNQAIDRDGSYYEYYLGRGLVYDDLGQSARAKRDLEISNGLLPTAAASYSLGGFALEEGKREEAKRLFWAASDAGGEIGKMAREAYIKLDIVDDPGRYVATEIYFENDHVVITVENSTWHELRDVVVRIDATINKKPVEPRLRQVDRLEAKALEVVQPGIHYREEDEVEVETSVLQARPAS